MENAQLVREAGLDFNACDFGACITGGLCKRCASGARFKNTLAGLDLGALDHLLGNLLGGEKSPKFLAGVR
jgi:hypothetical protein